MKLMETHEAVFNRATETLEGIVEVWDYLPANLPTPFVVLGRLSIDFPNSLITKTGEGYALTQKIHVVTKAMEKHKAADILVKIKKAFDEELSIEGATVLLQQPKSGYVEETADAEFYGELDVEIWLEDY